MGISTLDELARQYGLQETEFKAMSDLADYIGESFAHLLILPKTTINQGEWLGAFELENSVRPVLLFRTSAQYNPNTTQIWVVLV